MEKLKCSSCGGEIIVDNDKEYGTCPYCGTKYKLNEDLNVNIKLDDNMKEVISSSLGTAKHFSKFLLIPVFMFIIIFIIIVFSVFKVILSSNNKFNQERDKSSFNFQFVNYDGTKNAIFVKLTLEEIVRSNKTNDRLVSLVYEGQDTTDEQEIIDIKHSLSGDYEVSFNYDSDGYINKIILEKID